MTREMVKEEHKYFNMEGLEGSLLDARGYLDNLINEFGHDARICIISIHDYGEYRDDLRLFYYRPETDQEVAKRLKILEKDKTGRKKEKANKETRERKELARLQKRYPDVR